jgi:hypothetical protein
MSTPVRIPKSATEEVRAKVARLGDRQLLSLQVWSTPDAGRTWSPSDRVVTLPLYALPDLLIGLATLEDEAQRQEWPEGETEHIETTEDDTQHPVVEPTLPAPRAHARDSGPARVLADAAFERLLAVLEREATDTQGTVSSRYQARKALIEAVVAFRRADRPARPAVVPRLKTKKPDPPPELVGLPHRQPSA